MIKDISIGQFFPGNSLLHKLDPRAKIIILIVYIVTLFLCKNFFSLGVLFAASVVAVIVSKISFRTVLKGLKAIIVIIVFTSVLQIFYNNEGYILWKPFENREFAVTTGGVYTAVFVTIRIVSLILASSLLTYTTSPTMLTDAIERLLSPLKVFKINIHSFAMMMTIALRFIPTLIEEVDIIMSAQKARGANLETGTIKERAKALIPVFVPLFVNSFRRAVDLAFAMECRCYSGDGKRTRMRVMRFCAADWCVLAACLLLTAGVIFTNIYDFGGFFIFESVI